jgi:transposase-like protein
MGISCPECHAEAVNKYGKTAGRKQRYICLVCSRQFVADPEKNILRTRPHCPNCGKTMHSYMKGEDHIRFRCSDDPTCRTFLKVSLSKLTFERIRGFSMNSKKYSIQDFINRTNSLRSWEVMYLAEKEATSAERTLIREKSLNDTKREEISTYAKMLKEFVTYTKSTISAPTSFQKRNLLLNHS